MTMQQALETAYNDWNKQKSAQHDENLTQDVSNIIEESSELINNSQSVITSSSSDSFKSFKHTTEIPFYYGNPTVDLVKGFVHIYKDW